MRRVWASILVVLCATTACSAFDDATDPTDAGNPASSASSSSASSSSSGAVTTATIPAPPIGDADVEADCAGPLDPISPLIYGIGYRGWESQDPPDQWSIGATSRRWGGNPTSRYNWASGHFWNTASDFYFRNISIQSGETSAHAAFLTDSAERGMASLVTIPMLGWVAKDEYSYSFPVSYYGPQQDADPGVPDAGNGRTPDGAELNPGPPETTSIASTPADATAFVRDLVDIARTGGFEPPAIYFLDNEPDLWHETHRDVRREPVTYDELVELGITYGRAIEAGDPDAVIAGPSPWGWPTYFSSAADLLDNEQGGADADDHDGVPILAWYLQQMRLEEERSGERLLDLLDIHYYPQADGSYGNQRPDADDPEAASRRVRSTFSLWHPTYVDESWIDQTVALIPRMRELIDTNYPGTGLSIGEYNFGGETEISGGVAIAEVLGVFGRFGVDSASYWTYPPLDSPVANAFRAYRDFDGNGRAFLDQSVPVRTAQDDVGVYASTSEDGGVVMVLVHRGQGPEVSLTVDLQPCRDQADLSAVEVFSDGGTGTGVRPLGTVLDGASAPLELTLAPWSITVVAAR